MKVKGIGFFALMSFCLFIFSTSVAWSQVSSAITSYSDNVTIKQLLEEVRELRRVMQKNGTVALSTQVLLERVRMQQQRVDALTRDAETVRQKIKDFENNLPRAVEAVALSEKKVEMADSPSQRADREQDVRDIKGEVERYKKDLQEFKERDVQMTARINVEQARLEEYNIRLDSVERELECNAAETDQPKSKSKRP